MVATPSKLIAFAAAICAATFVDASPLNANPETPNANFVPLTPSHPAFGGPLRSHAIQPLLKNDPYEALAESLPILSNTTDVELPGKAHAAQRNLQERHLEEVGGDIHRLEEYFGQPMERNLKVLNSQYRSGSSKSTPWPSGYWPTYQDSINYRWKRSEPSPAEKYATAFKHDVKQFVDQVSLTLGIQGNAGNPSCRSDASCARGSKCAIRNGATSGYCIPTWWGICHAWAPAAILEVEPRCDVVKNGVTFHPFDIKGLVTAVYDGAGIPVVFTGARFDGPDTPANLDKYGRFTDDARRDLGPGFFHIAVSNIMGKFKQSFVVDVTAGAEVWNQPVRDFQVLRSDVYDANTAAWNYFRTSKYPFNPKATLVAYTKMRFRWIVEANVDGPLVPGAVDQYTQYADYEYLLELDNNHNILGGEWLRGSRTEHPDFLWFAKGKPNADLVTKIGLSYKEVSELLAASAACKPIPTPAPTPKPTTPTPTTLAPTPKPTTPKPTTSAPVTPTPKPTTPTPTTLEPVTLTPKPTTSTPVTPVPTAPTGQTPAPTAPTGQTPAPTAPTGQTPAPTAPTGQTPAPTTAKPTEPPTGQTPTPTTGVPPVTPCPVTSKPDTPAPTTGVPPVTPCPVTSKPDTPAPTSPTGQTPAPTSPTGQTPAPTKPTGETPAPTTPTGQTPAPTSPTGQTPEPTKPTGQTPAPTSPTGETPAPTKPTGQTPAPTSPTGETPAPTKPTGETPAPTSPPTGQTPAPETPAPETPKPTKPHKHCH